MPTVHVWVGEKMSNTSHNEVSVPSENVQMQQPWEGGKFREGGGGGAERSYEESKRASVADGDDDNGGGEVELVTVRVGNKGNKYET